MRGELKAKGRRQDPHGITPAYAGRTHRGRVDVPETPDHPRVCGENPDERERGTRPQGSPPRMRGERAEDALRAAGLRITPAYAGRTHRPGRELAVRRDHPRVCGENVLDPDCADPVVGSPPRMRGEPQEAAAPAPRPRITPAYAGRTGLRDAVGNAWKDHPRVCGENPRTALSVSREPGSPPRMRGEQQVNRAGTGPIGITPAYAGRTHGRTGLVPPFYGSPPRMRGEPIRPARSAALIWITPAYAGRTRSPSPRTRMPWDHPRVCGENDHLAAHPLWVPGSPPRMRGELLEAPSDVGGVGITPAYAGRTWPGRGWRTCWWDHPRVCGENRICRESRPGLPGSPPRMRGERLSRRLI